MMKDFPIDFKEVPRHIVLVLLVIYKKVVSPALLAAFGPACRYEETCSSYAIRVVQQRGVVRGVGMAIARVLSCNSLGITFEGCRKWTKKFL